MTTRAPVRWLPVTGALLLLIALALGAWVVRTVDPARTSLLPDCKFYQATGLQCPGCGMTRATHHLLHGRLAQALFFNAFYVSLLPVLALWGAWWVRHWWTARPLTPRALQINAWLGGTVLASWLAFWLLRNSPGWPLL